MKNSKYIAIVTLVLIAAFVACDRLDMVGMFAGTSPTIDQRFQVSQLYNKEAGFATLKATQEEYHVYVCTDTHITDTRTRWQHFINTYRADDNCPVAVHLGDIIDAKTDFSYVEEALMPQTAESDKTDTLMAVCGNHDIYFRLWDKFVHVFKTSTYYFVVETPSGAKDLFIVYDSADGTVGKLQLQWLRETLEWADTQDFRHIVACTHTHFFKRDSSQGHTSNYTQEETYALLNLFNKHKVSMVWSGHDHSREVTQVKNMTCIVVDSMKDNDKKPFYMLVTMGETIDYEFIPVP